MYRWSTAFEYSIELFLLKWPERARGRERTEARGARRVGGVGQMYWAASRVESSGSNGGRTEAKARDETRTGEKRETCTSILVFVRAPNRTRAKPEENRTENGTRPVTWHVPLIQSAAVWCDRLVAVAPHDRNRRGHQTCVWCQCQNTTVYSLHYSVLRMLYMCMNWSQNVLRIRPTESLSSIFLNWAAICCTIGLCAKSSSRMRPQLQTRPRVRCGCRTRVRSPRATRCHL